MTTSEKVTPPSRPVFPVSSSEVGASCHAPDSGHFLPRIGMAISSELDTLSGLLSEAGYKDMKEACIQAKKMVDASPYALPPPEERQFVAIITKFIEVSQKLTSIEPTLTSIREKLEGFLIS